MTVNRRLVLPVLLAAAALSGCGADPVGPPVPVGAITLLDPLAWPGATIRFASEEFRSWGDDVMVEINGVELAATRVDPTTVSVTLPTDATASMTAPVLHYAGQAFTLPTTLRVAGFASSMDLTPSAHIAWDAYATTLGGAPNAIGGNLDGDLALVNMINGEVSTVPGALDWNRLRGPGMTPVPGVWVLKGSGGLEDWQLNGNPGKVADHPEFTPTSTRQVARLSPDAWLTTTSQAWSIWTRPDAATNYAVTAQGSDFNDAQGILLAPGGDRAVVRVNRVLAGVPVFDTEAGDVAFVTDLTSILGAAFTPDGTALALVGGTAGLLPGGLTEDHSRIEVLDATDGSVQVSRDLDAEAFAVAFCPGTGQLLVGVSSGAAHEWRPRIMVLDATDLATVAVLPAPTSAPTCGTIGNCFGSVLAIDGETVAVFWSWNGAPPHLWHFQLLPPPA